MMINTMMTFLMQFHLSSVTSFAIAVVALLLLLILLAWLTNQIVKKYLIAILQNIAKRSFSTFGQHLIDHQVFYRLSHLGPAIIIYYGINLVAFSKYQWVVSLILFIKSLSIIYMLMAVAWFLMAFIDALYYCYHTKAYLQKHPFRSYLQVVKIIVWSIVVILAASVLLDKSPWAFIAGLGALSAVFMLVFQDTILGFVASIQASIYDIVKIGDWVTISQYKVDGDVVDISINTVKVQNFDKTIVTIPTSALIKTGVQNWRGMQQSGGRRIKRSILIDIDTIRFCDSTLLQRLSKVDYIGDYLQKNHQEVLSVKESQQMGQVATANHWQLTNSGLFREYTKRYLQNHPSIHQHLTFLVRQLQPRETGLPIELYIFTNDTRWIYYEDIQASVFDHLLAMLSVFDLRAFQLSSSHTNLVIER